MDALSHGLEAPICRIIDKEANQVSEGHIAKFCATWVSSH